MEKGLEGIRRGGRTGLIYMPMHYRYSPRAPNDPTPVLSKGRDKHVVIPRKAFNKSEPMFVRTHAGEVTLESGSCVIRVRKVKVLGHIHLTEHCEQPLFFDEVVDLVVGRYREHVRAL